MAAAKKSASRKKKPVRAKKGAAVKKGVSAKKRVVKKAASTTSRKEANVKRAALAAKLRAELKATKALLKAAKESAKAEVKAARDAANAEVTAMKVQLVGALKREKELVALGEKKAQMMLAAGARWEKAQLKKIEKLGTSVRKRVSKKKAS